MDLYVIGHKSCTNCEAIEIKAICSSEEKAKLVMQREKWEGHYYKITRWILDELGAGSKESEGSFAQNEKG